jgi:hypothetical protein
LNNGNAPPSAAKPSYRDATPLEEGGRTAREGFGYQDHVAVNKCLDMLLPGGPSEVWCEAEDDLVLVWHLSAEVFEFVQVKGLDIKQAWSVARICALKDGKKKSSIFEKSLAHDRCKESCRFRMVTTWAPDGVLDVLRTPHSARAATEVRTQLGTAASAIETHLGPQTSPNGNSVAFWVDNTEWEHRACIGDIVNENLVKLHRVLDLLGLSLAPDQCDELHAAMIAKVQEAALADAVTQPAEKRLLRDQLRAWLVDRAKKILHPTHSGATAPLEGKLAEASLDDALIEAAKDLRRRYVAEARVPKYLDADDREMIEGEVIATLHALKVGLDVGKYNESGAAFLLRCQEALQQKRHAMGQPPPPVNLLYGCMYEVMNRCLHRLARVRP